MATLAVAPMIYIVFIISYFSYLEYYPKSDFDSSAWETNEEERFKMSKDIIESDMLIGKTKAEVIEILGSDFSTYDDNHIAYYLGFVPGMFNIDPDVLDIHFANSKVVKVDQHET